MQKKALIFDLDNTIFPVPSIGNKLFAPLFELIQKDGHHDKEIDKIKDEIMRKPFEKVAAAYKFSKNLIKKSMKMLEDLVFEGKIETYPDYPIIKGLPVDKYLVTAGFTKMQKAKIKGLEIEKDFKEIHILDHSKKDIKKAEVFRDIVKRHGYLTNEVLVIGDDPDSEIKSAQEMGLGAILYDHEHRLEAKKIVPIISDYSQLMQYM